MSFLRFRGLTLPPVLERELRARTRGGGLGWQRLAAAAVAATALLILDFADDSSAAPTGQRLFLQLNGLTALALAFICPALTSDIISRERRENTLGLLRLTPLSPRQLVLGKAWSGLVHTAVLWLAAAPILGLPVVMGGITVAQVILSLVAQAALAVVSLAIGLAASAWTLQAANGLLVAYGLMLGTFLVCGAPGAIIAADLFKGAAGGSPWVGAILTLGLAALVTVTLLGLAGQEVASHWRSDPSEARPARPLAWNAGPGPADEPAAEPKDRRRRLRLLQRDPVRWLLSRRLDPLLHLPLLAGAIALVLVPWDAGQPPPRLVETVSPLVIILVGARLYRSERQNGELEMLLCTPAGSKRFFGAMASVIWGLALPTAVFQGITLAWSAWQHPDEPLWLRFALFLSTLLVLPAHLLFTSFRTRAYVAAVIATGVLTILAPRFLARAIEIGQLTWQFGDFNLALRHPAEETLSSLLLQLAFLLLIGALTAASIRRDLQRRDFVLRPIHD